MAYTRLGNLATFVVVGVWEVVLYLKLRMSANGQTCLPSFMHLWR